MESTQKNKTYVLKRHFVDMMRWQDNPTPWPRMILSAVATCIPLVVGLLRGELVISIYGALTGYVLALSDHLGPLRHRLWTVSLTFALIAVGYAFGHFFPGHQVVFLIVFAALVYWLGVLAGEGAELEKTLLFTTIALVSSNAAKPLPPQIIPLLWLYAALGYSTLVTGILVQMTLRRPIPENITGFKNVLKKTLALRRQNRVHAAAYALTALASIWMAYYCQSERTNWVTITVLLVMKPDQNPIFYRAFQRFAGTILAILCVDVLIALIRDPLWLIPLIIACALGMPWAIKKNYWLVSFLATIMVVLLLELVSPQPFDLHTPFVRLTATLLGCALGLAGLALSRIAGSIIGSAK